MAESIAELRKLSDEDLVNRHDQLASSTVVGTHHYLDELQRRDQQRLAQTMLKYTRWITVMTAVVTTVTIINIAVIMA